MYATPALVLGIRRVKEGGGSSQGSVCREKRTCGILDQSIDRYCVLYKTPYLPPSPDRRRYLEIAGAQVF